MSFGEAFSALDLFARQEPDWLVPAVVVNSGTKPLVVVVEMAKLYTLPTEA